ALSTRPWDSVEHYAAMLEDFTRAEPLPWSDLFIARGRALAPQSGRRPRLQMRGAIRPAVSSANPARYGGALDPRFGPRDPRHGGMTCMSCMTRSRRPAGRVPRKEAPRTESRL